MTLDEGFFYLFAGLVASLILWQLVTGKVLGENWRVAATRRNQPFWYWLVITGQCVILAILFLIDDDE